MRKDPFVIMKEILDTLERGNACSINELSRETGLHNVTVRKYVRIIELVERKPEVEVIKTRHSIIVRVRK